MLLLIIRSRLDPPATPSDRVGTHIVKYSTTTAVDTSRRHRKQLTPVGALTRDPWQTSARRIFGADLPRSRRGTVPTIYVSVQCIPCGHSIWLYRFLPISRTTRTQPPTQCRPEDISCGIGLERIQPSLAGSLYSASLTCGPQAAP